MTLWAIKLAVVLALLAGAVGYGHHSGADRVQRKWDARVQADKEAADAAREVDRLRSSAAATKYEAQRAAIASRAAQVSPEVRNALSAPICRPLGASAPGVRLGDLAVPAAVVDRLRRAGADF